MGMKSRFRRRLKRLVKRGDKRAIKHLFITTATRAAMERGEGAIDELRQILHDEWYGNTGSVRFDTFDDIDLD